MIVTFITSSCRLAVRLLQMMYIYVVYWYNDEVRLTGRCSAVAYTVQEYE